LWSEIQQLKGAIYEYNLEIFKYLMMNFIFIIYKTRENYDAQN